MPVLHKRAVALMPQVGFEAWNRRLNGCGEWVIVTTQMGTQNPKGRAPPTERKPHRLNQGPPTLHPACLLQHATAFPSPKPPRGPYLLAWATLLRRVFAIDVLHCERRGGRLQLVALIQIPQVAEKILAHLRLSTTAPAAAPARAAPQAPEQLGLFAQDGIDPIPPSWHD
jgi:hypothetical protein